MTTPASRIDTLINKEKERVEVLTVRALSYLGELCAVSYTHLTLPTILLV